MDPRVTTSMADLQKQHDLSMLCYEGRKKITEISKETISIHAQIKELTVKAKGDLLTSLNNLDEKITNIENAKPNDKLKSFNQLYDSFASLFNTLQESDMPPSTQTIEAVKCFSKKFSTA